jgi:hypothetical protein
MAQPFHSPEAASTAPDFPIWRYFAHDNKAICLFYAQIHVFA